MIAIIKYNAGNIASVQNSLSQLGCESIITDDRQSILAADKVIFPGVGAANTAMSYLRDKGLDQTILSVEKPMLGICLGLQLMCQSSEEGAVDCLGIFDAKVKQFPALDKVPHMGWNNFSEFKGDLFKDFQTEDNVYFVHAYHAELSLETVARCDYICEFSAAMQKDNFYATQFHPEKSGTVGFKLLKNFLSL